MQGQTILPVGDEEETVTHVMTATSQAQLALPVVGIGSVMKV